MGEPVGSGRMSGAHVGALVWVIMIPGLGQEPGGFVGPFQSKQGAGGYAVARRYEGFQVTPWVWLVESAWVADPPARVKAPVL